MCARALEPSKARLRQRSPYLPSVPNRGTKNTQSVIACSGQRTRLRHSACALLTLESDRQPATSDQRPATSAHSLLHIAQAQAQSAALALPDPFDPSTLQPFNPSTRCACLRALSSAHLAISPCLRSSHLSQRRSPGRQIASSVSSAPSSS
jgi:hypothetical protein